MNWAVRAALVRGKWPEPAKEEALRSVHGGSGASRMCGKSGRLARLVGPKASDAEIDAGRLQFQPPLGAPARNAASVATRTHTCV
ncbi:hypothetical protein HPB47_019705 [Ixodes persulcatus]|uniref:Uncharacterized protein n=1 Tax=Ixodes persulcatus TaxID=34615 RepID=A0AC60QHF0_IXOPE|nr:hypothetical protein HPB47_019705 [Ixodes persulcatus]